MITDLLIDCCCLESGLAIVRPASMPLRLTGWRTCLHSFVCKRAPGRSARHHAIAHSLWHLLLRESRSQKNPKVCRGQTGSDPMVGVNSMAGKALTWDVTVVRPLADSHVHTAAHDAGAVAELVASTLRWKVITCFSQLRWNCSARLTVQLSRFSVVSVHWLPKF